MTPASPVAIVGGGIAGLAAAHALHERGLPFVLLEAASRLGGVIRTERVDGYLLEGGPDSLLVQKPEGLALVRALGLEPRLVPTNPKVRTVYVLHRGRLHPLPEGMLLTVPTRVWPVLRSSLFSLAGKLRMGLDLVLPARRETSDESIASFVRRRFGPEALERLAEPLLGGIHAGDPETLSLQATFPRLLALERTHGSLVRGLRATATAPAAAASMPPSAFVSLQGGLAELVDGLVARLPEATLRTGTTVEAVERSGSGFILRTSRGDLLSSEAVIVALPPRASATLLGPLLPEAAKTLGSLRAASTVVLVLGFARDRVAHPLDGYGLIVPRTEGLRTTAASFYSTKFEGRAPAGRVALRVFLGGMRDSAASDLDEAALVDLALRELGPVLGLSGKPDLVRVFRWPNATPQMEVGHADKLSAVERTLASIPGLFLTGAGLRGTGLPDTIGDAQRTAAAAAAFLAGRP